MTLIDTILIEYSPSQISIYIPRSPDMMQSCCPIGIYEVIPFSIYLIPFFLDIARTVIISPSIAILYPNTRYKLAVLFKPILSFTNFKLARHCNTILEVVPITINSDPAGHELTKLRIAIYTVYLIEEEAGIRILADVYALLAEVVVEAFDFLDAVSTFAVNVVGVAAVFVDPAVLKGIDEGVGIAEVCIVGSEIAASFAGVVRIDERLQAEGSLVFRLLAEGVQRACAQIDLIADVTGIDCGDAVLAVPCSVGLRRKLNTVYDAKRVRCRRIDRRGPVDPSERQFYRVLGFVNLGLFEREVIVDQLDLCYIHIEVLIKVDNRRYFSKDADALSKLKQERPCRRAFHIGAGQHVRKFRQLIGNRD